MCTQTTHLSCAEINTVSKTDRSELSLHARYLGVQLGAPKMNSDPVACSAQTVHKSCSDINTISEQIKTSFHLTHAT
jgi:hypothetical protein